MPRSQTSEGVVRGGLAALAMVAALASGSTAYAQAADDIVAGRQLFLQKANCQACHGWAGDGRKMDSQMPDGANLREIPIDRETLVKTVKCGRPGTGMPAFDRLAYSDGRCFGLKLNDLRARGLEMPDPPSTLAPIEVERLADFLFAKVIGKGPIDHAGCVDFWGSDVEVCKELKK
jgi:Cytochrome C oxidase, cbb3-type, subunit III